MIYTVTVIFHSVAYPTLAYNFNAQADADAFDSTVAKCRQYVSSTKNY